MAAVASSTETEFYKLRCMIFALTGRPVTNVNDMAAIGGGDSGQCLR